MATSSVNSALAMLKVTARPVQSRHCGSTSVSDEASKFCPAGTA